MRRGSSFTFQLFIYESLSIQYHYSIKRTRDVPLKLFMSYSSYRSFYLINPDTPRIYRGTNRAAAITGYANEIFYYRHPFCCSLLL